MSATQKLIDGTIPAEYYDVPLRALNHQTRQEICLYLDPNLITGNNWKMMAQMIGMRAIEIENIELRTNMTECVLREAFQRNYTVGQFIELMRKSPMERLDLIEGCANLIANDVRNYRPLQVAEVSSEAAAILTLGELASGEKEYFDAFVSYHPEDNAFIRELINKVEIEFGMKLCIRERDLCMGVSENLATADLMEKRCKRVILVLSQNYMESEELQAILKWQIQFALALAPAADRMHKIVPLVIDSGITVPKILLPYNVSDYTKAYTREWFWSRLEGSLSAPTNSSGGYEGPAGKLGKADSLRDDNVSAVSSCSSRSSSSVHLPTQESIHRESRRDESKVSAATGSDQDTLERSSSGCSSLTGPSSVFYVPLPNNSKRKVKYKWDKTSASYTT